MDRFILMIQFFTRIPINKRVNVEEEDIRKGSIYMPIIGLIVGGISAAFYLLSSLTGNKFFASVMAVLAWSAVTGALHLDGLSDTSDGFFSSRSRERILEIMKDSRIGTMGALALIFCVLLKVSLIWGLDGKRAAYSIIISASAGRAALLFGLGMSRYARDKGLGKSFIGNITMKEAVVGFLIFSILVIPFMKIYFLILLPIIIITPWLFNKYVESKIGGMTGDTLGALCETHEVLCLIVFNILSMYIWR